MEADFSWLHHIPSGDGKLWGNYALGDAHNFVIMLFNFPGGHTVQWGMGQVFLCLLPFVIRCQ